MTTPDILSIECVKWEPVRLSHVKPWFSDQEQKLANCPELWHKFIIFNGANYTRDVLLRAIITSCEPELLLPVRYRIETDNKTVFLAKECPGAIENLYKQGMNIIIPGGQIIYLDIVLGFLNTNEFPINPMKTLTQILHTRYEPMKKVLSLDEFETEKALGSIYCPLSAPKVLQFVLRCTKAAPNYREIRLPIRELSLKYNKLKAIILYEKFFTYHLTKLDLRHNQILEVEYLRYFVEFKITELWLDGNPLCAKYTKPEDYIQDVLNVFPHLQKLDGISIGVEKKFSPTIQHNYLDDGSKTNLIKQFVEHFFTLYDQDDRIVMNGLYDKDSLYSMTLGPISNQTHQQITKGFSTNRNLLKFVDYAKCHEFLMQGPEKIISTLRHQPPTLHNYKTFHIDLLHYSEGYIVLSVQGSFAYKNLSCPPMMFSRILFVMKKDDDEFCVRNDQYHIEGPSVNTSHNNESTSNAKNSRFNVKKFKPNILSSSEKNQLVIFLRELSTMNKTFCEKYLEKSMWNIRKAISNFMKDYTLNEVPPEAF